MRESSSARWMQNIRRLSFGRGSAVAIALSSVVAACLGCTFEMSDPVESVSRNDKWRALEPAVPPDLLRIAQQQCLGARPPYETFLAEGPKYASYYPHVLAWLKEAPKDTPRECLTNALKFLGAARPQEAASDLKFFIEAWSDARLDESSPRSFLELVPVTSALHAVSIALRSKKLPSAYADALFEYLADSANPTTWDNRNLSWTWVDERSRRSALYMMTSASLNAIALSGHPQGVSRLQSLRVNAELKSLFPGEEVFHLTIDGHIDAAMEAGQ